MRIRSTALCVVAIVLLLAAACDRPDPETVRLEQQLAETTAKMTAARERAQFFTILTCVSSAAGVLLFIGGIVLGSNAKRESHDDPDHPQLRLGDRPP